MAYRNIIQAMISNAIEYTPREGKIIISLTPNEADKKFTFSVKDTGIGIPKSEQNDIFKKFIRASNAKLTKPDGTGLGMYIAWQAAKMLGGKIWFESEENKGTTFYAELPMESKESKAPLMSEGKPMA